MILMHGRGGSPGDMQALSRELDRPRFACLAPAAAGRTWYPYSFLERIQRNEPHLSSALRLLKAALVKAEAGGVPTARVVLLGFSQGACLALEFAARNARRYGAVIGLSGGLIGPEGTPRDYAGSFDGTPAFLGSSDVDPHVPKRRVDETAAVLRRLGANESLFWGGVAVFGELGLPLGVDRLVFHRAGGIAEQRLDSLQVAQNRVGLLEVVQVRTHVLRQRSHRFEPVRGREPELGGKAHPGWIKPLGL